MKEKESKELDAEIEDLELADMSAEQIERKVKAFSAEGMSIRRKRKNIRYRLRRIQTEFNGGPASEDVNNLKEHFEKEPLFGGWKFYGITWDVAITEPMVCIHRDKSLEQEWNEIVAAKFPTIEFGTGRVSYPDITVKEKVMAQDKKMKKAKKKTTKKPVKKKVAKK